MTRLETLIKKITEAENALCNELKREDLGLALDYREINEKLIKELCSLLPSLDENEKKVAIEFLKAYQEHINEQKQFILSEQTRVKEQYKSVKTRHNISNKYSQTRKNTTRH